MLSKSMLLCLLLMFASTTPATSEDCKWVKLKADGSIAYHDDKLNEKYEKQSITNNGKSVFKRHNGDEYIYWLQSPFAWVVGNTVGSAVVSMFALSNETHPADIPKHQTWYVASGFFWATYSSIRVECTLRPLKSWEIGLIIGGAVVFVAVVIGLLVRCIKKNKETNTNVSPMRSDPVTGIPLPYMPQQHDGFVTIGAPPAYSQHPSNHPAYTGPVAQRETKGGPLGREHNAGIASSSGLWVPHPALTSGRSALPPLPTHRPAASSTQAGPSTADQPSS